MPTAARESDDAIRDLLSQGKSERTVARELEVSRHRVARVASELASSISTATSGDTSPAVVTSEDENAATVRLHTDRPVKTLADAIRVAEVDESIWYVDRWECSLYTVPMKVEQGQRVQKTADGSTLAWNAAQPIQTQQYRVKVFLKRILPRRLQDAMKAVFADLKNAAPKWPKLAGPSKVKSDTFLALFGIFDAHLGKLCWHGETGENYDLKIAETLFKNAVEDLIAESAHRHVSKILLPVGNDFFHVDTRTHTTTRGTPQDVDGRFSKMLATGIKAVIWAVEAMAAVAPVQVELVPGNHDRTLSECLCHVLDARFHHTDRVTVGLEPKTRKYVRFGCNLIGLTHGDLVKPADLPLVMPAECPREWAATTCREWITGHGHREMKWTTKDTDSSKGTKVRMLRSLTRTDLYHYDHGYFGEQPGAELLLYGFDRGYTAHCVVPARGA